MTKRAEGLLGEIERGLRDESTSTCGLLRKCLLLGGHAGSETLRAWARKELHGYQPEDDLPSYRKVPAPLLISYRTLAGSDTQIISPAALPKEARDAGIGECVPMRFGLGELEDSLRLEKPFHQFSLPHASTIIELMNARSASPHQVLDRVYWEVGTPAIRGVVDKVRTKLTEVIAELIATLPDGAEVPTQEAVARAMNAVNITGDGNAVTVYSAQATDNGTSTLTSPQAAAGPRETFWQRWRKRGIVIGIATVIAAAAAVVTWLEWTPWK